jgi:hypothetical protein
MLSLLATIAAADELRIADGHMPTACDVEPNGHRHDPSADAFCEIHDCLIAYDQARAGATPNAQA